MVVIGRLLVLFRSSGNYPKLIFHFELKRSILYFILETYVPSSLLVVLSWVSFWISQSSVPARICIGTSYLLNTCSSYSVPVFSRCWSLSQIFNGRRANRNTPTKVPVYHMAHTYTYFSANLSLFV